MLGNRRGGILLTNILTNADFADGTTGYAETVGGNATVSIDTARLKIIKTVETSAGMTITTAISPVSGHTYYYRYKEYYTSDTLAQLNVRAYYYDPTIFAPTNYVLKNVDTEFSYSGVTAMTTQTEIRWSMSIGTSEADNIIRFMYEPIIIDLTLAFGAGNEPDSTWCDANIPFFATSIVI